jgi:hypothetical protein
MLTFSWLRQVGRRFRRSQVLDRVSQYVSRKVTVPAPPAYGAKEQQRIGKASLRARAFAAGSFLS